MIEPKRLRIAMLITLLPLVTMAAVVASAFLFHGCATTSDEERAHFDAHGNRKKG